MAKISRGAVIAEALALLDEVGLDAVSTRRIAGRLNVEQPSLYWHFRRKHDLLTAMAEAAMIPHTIAALPEPSDDWRDWFLENSRSFRRTLLRHRDGARLHAGLTPVADLDRLLRKMKFLTDAGIPEQDAQMAMLAASRFTVGSVLEEQAELGEQSSADIPQIDHDSAFEAGLALIADGLDRRVEKFQAEQSRAEESRAERSRARKSRAPQS